MSETLPSLRVLESDGSPNAIPVYTIEISGATVTRISATGVRILIDSGAGASGAPTTGEYLTYAANATLSAERVIAASDNITIVSSGTSFLISAITNAGGSSVIYAQSGDLFLAYGASTNMTAERIVAASDNITIISSGTSFLISAVTNNISNLISAEYLSYAANATLSAERVVAASNNITIVSSGTSFLLSATTSPTRRFIRIPMALMSVEVNSGNAYWTAQTDQGTVRMDKAYVNMTDSGRSISTWWCDVPTNLDATPAWTLDIVSEAAILGATGGLAVLFIDGMTVTHGESANTVAGSTAQLVAGNSFLMQTAGILTISTMTATNFDATLATSATDYMKVKITRMGNVDTFNSDWYIYSLRAGFFINA